MRTAIGLRQQMEESRKADVWCQTGSGLVRPMKLANGARPCPHCGNDTRNKPGDDA